MFNRRKFIAAMPAAALALSMGLSVSAQAQEGPAGSPPWTIGFSQDTMDQPWRAFMVTSAQAQAKKYPELIKEFIFTDAKGTNEKQIADVEDLISRGVDLIMMSPREAQALVPAVEAIKKAGIPLIVLDREVVGEDYNVFIGGNNLQIGEGLGKYAVDKLGDKWNFLEIEGVPGATPTIQRHEGFASALAGKDGIKRLDAQPANYDLAPALHLRDAAVFLAGERPDAFSLSRLMDRSC